MSKKLYTSVLYRFAPGKTLVAAVGLIGMCYSAGAVPVTVQEVGIGSHESVEIISSTLGDQWVYAGTLNLLVNGTATQGFCIDPFHWSVTGPQQYNSEPLALGPKAPVSGMGTTKALEIEQLWAKYFTPTINNQDAAGLQIAIWEIVGGANFQLKSGIDYGAGNMLSWLYKNPSAPAANLLAVTGPGQDYVIPCGPGVPDAGQTAGLLGIGMAAVAWMQSRFARKA